MKKIILIITWLTVFQCLAKAQTWSTVGSANTLHDDVYAMIEYNSILYVGGSFSVSSNAPGNGIAQWNGAIWDSVGSGVNGYILAIAVYNAEIYVAGGFTMAGGNPARNIAKWNGTSWSSLGSGLNDYVYSLCVYNGELYAGGAFDSAGGVFAQRIAKWNGNNWSGVGTGFDGGFYGPKSMAVYNGDLYVSGANTINGSPAFGIAKWNGINWSTVYGTGIPLAYNPLCVYNGELYAARTTSVSGADIAKWNGSTWTIVGTVTNPYHASMVEVYSMAVYNSELYVGGKFFRVAGNLVAPQICKWDGVNWSVFGGVHCPGCVNDTSTWSAPWITSMCAYGSDIIIGGNFTRAGSNSFVAENIARFTSSATEIREELTLDKLNLFPNPTTSELIVSSSELGDIERIEIYSSLGEKIFKRHPSSDIGHLTISVADFPPGIYFITVTDQTGNKVTKKVVKM